MGFLDDDRDPPGRVQAGTRLLLVAFLPLTLLAAVQLLVLSGDPDRDWPEASAPS